MDGIKERYLKKAVAEDLSERMVFVGGPRQVGKTTFALSFLKNPSIDHPAYMNWDDVHARAAILNGELPILELQGMKCWSMLVVMRQVHGLDILRNSLNALNT